VPSSRYNRFGLGEGEPMLHPFRLFILGILFYILYKLLSGGTRKPVGKSAADQTVPPAEDVLVEDPECHTLIPRKQAVEADLDGKTHYFCSQKCRDIFAENLNLRTEKGAGE
jgi:YHS domain-containing protein